MSTRPTRALAWVIAWLPLAFAACEGPDGTSEEDTGEVPLAYCELADTVPLADAEQIAANGRTGAELLAAIPEDVQSTLHWDLSNSRAEVEVAGAAGQSSALELAFAVPASPSFVFEDRVAVYPEGALGGELICDDYVRTTIDVSAQTMDGALSIEVAEVEVRLGPDHPDLGEFASPFVSKVAALASPDVTFVSPVSQPADDEKTVTLVFEGPKVTGAITVYASDGEDTHSIVVARW